MALKILKNLIILSLINFCSNYGFAQSPMQVAGTATKTATTSGNWSAASTWGGSLPITDDRVLIPSGITVTVDGMISEELKSIRIDNGGKLQFATNVNTELRTEYLFSSMMGILEIGTSANKISSNVKANLVFAERGGTTSSFDPERFAPGAVLMGTTTMHGFDKTSWLTLQTQPLAGATQFVLNAAPTGWQVGDKLVVAGTDPITNASISSTSEFERDEVVTITAVSGNMVTFTPALVRNHTAPAQAPDLDVHVANLSRNIVISSENTSVTSISGEFRKPRGHLMFMHTLDVNLKYVEANNLGRTDKTITLDDWDFADLARDPNTGQPVPDGGRNPRGRYSIHFHRGGLDVSVIPARPITPLPTPALVEGCVVNNDPGWGFVNHSSRVDFVRNVSYDVVGGAFNTEAGNETGSFIENIAIRTVNSENPVMTAPRPRNSYLDLDGEGTEALADVREGRQDFAWQGDGFWLHGTGVTVQGNVVSGCTGHAYVYWTDGLIEKGLGMARGDIDAHVPASEFPALNQALHDWQTTYPNFWLDIWYLQPRPFTNNIAYGFPRGVTTYYVHTEFHQALDPNVGGFEERFNDLPPIYKDQLNLVFDNTILWNIGRRGFLPEISTNITIQNSRVVGYNGRTGIENYGTNPAPNYINDEPEMIGIDLDHYHNTHSWTLNNNIVEGFSGSSVGIALPINAQVTVNGGTFDNSGRDILIGASNRHFEGGFGTGLRSTAPTKSEVFIQGAINFQNPNDNIVMDAEIIYDEIAGEGFALLSGTNPDPEFFFAPQEVTLNFGPFNNSKAYFNEQDASYIPLVTGGNNCAFSEPSECVEIDYLDLTNTELNTEFDNSYLGSIMPSNAVTHPMIVGGKLEEGTVGVCVNPSVIDQNTNCTEIYDPVCGCDGNTYSNSCVAMYYNGVTSWTVGECNICPTPSDIIHTVYSGDVTKLEWTAVAGAEKYKVRYRPVGGSWTEVNAPINQRFLNALSLSTSYQYQVKAVCASKNSVWSTTQTFTTTNEHCDYPASYVTFSGTTGARIVWEIYPAVTKFKLKYKPKNLGISWTEETIYGQEKDLTTLISGATYKYKLKSKCANYWTNWGPAQEFVAPTLLNNDTARNLLLDNQGINIYPNPATDLLNIELDDNALIELFNIVGQKMQTQQGTNGVNELNISTLTKGSYLIRITNGESEVVKKFIKQ